jgi:hypothetical protein
MVGEGGGVADRASQQSNVRELHKNRSLLSKALCTHGFP